MIQNTKLTLRDKFSYASGGVGKDLIAMFIGGYYMFYLTQVQGLKAGYFGIAFFLAKIWDGVNDPMMGMVVDNTKSKWGKYRPWIFAGAIINAAVNISMFFDISGSSQKYIYYTVIYILWGMTYTIMDIPYWSIIPSLSSTESERNSISSLARVSTGIGGLLVTALVPILLDNYLGKYSKSGYLKLSVIINIFYVILMIICAVFVKEKIALPSSPKTKLRYLFGTILKNDQLRSYILFITLIYTSMALTTGFGVYFFAYDLKNFGLTGIFSIVSFGGYGVAMLLYPVIGRKLGAKKAFNTSLLLVIAGYIMLFIATMLFSRNLEKVSEGIPVLNVTAAGLYSFIIIGLCGAFAFVGFGFASVCATVMIADTIDYGELKLGERTDGIVFSMQSFTYKFSGALSALVTGIGLELTGLSGLDPEKDTVGLLSTGGSVVMRTVMFIIPIIIVSLAMLVYNKKYKLTGEFKENMLKELYIKRNVK